MQRVVVTGLGAVTPLGVGVKHSWTNLINSRIGIRSLRERGPSFDGLPSQVAGLVPHGKAADGGWDASEWLSKDDQHRMALFTQYAMAAAQEAMADAKYEPDTEERRERMGVCVGSGIGSFDEVYDTSVAFSQGGYKGVSPLFVPRLLINLAAGHIAMRWGLQGPNTSPTTACTTGAHAIGDAARLIAFGDADVMLAGAAESCVHPLAIAGFARARSLSTGFNDMPERASRPFDHQRDGFVMGEGAGVLVLEEKDHALHRKAPIYGELIGYGLSCDASHMTAPLENGQGAYLAMRRALDHANKTVPPTSPRHKNVMSQNDEFYPPPDLHVDYVNAHATGTRLGDVTEVRAIKRALEFQQQEPASDEDGCYLPDLGTGAIVFPTPLTVSSTKGAIGHLLGAAGAVEAIFTLIALRESVIPPTMNLESLSIAPDDAGSAELWGDVNFVSMKAQHREMDVALTNSFGFGGTNASLCFKKAIVDHDDKD